MSARAAPKMALPTCKAELQPQLLAMAGVDGSRDRMFRVAWPLSAQGRRTSWLQMSEPAPHAQGISDLSARTQQDELQGKTQD